MMAFGCSKCGAKKLYDVSNMAKDVIAENLRRGLIHIDNDNHSILLKAV